MNLAPRTSLRARRVPVLGPRRLRVSPRSIEPDQGADPVRGLSRSGLRIQAAMSAPTGPVLVVDDDEAVRDSLKFVLELEGLDVRLYEGGARLLGEAKLPEAGCLVVDHHMPGMDGVELVGQLRGRKVGLPVILITGRCTKALRARAAQAGIRQVVEKPFEDCALLDGIRDALGLGGRL